VAGCRWLLVMVCLAACTTAPSQEVSDGDTVVAADVAEPDVAPVVLPGEGAVYAYLLSDPSDAPHGPGAYALPGRVWIVGNQRVRFAIQDAGQAVGLALQGGNLIDAQRRLDDGGWSADLFREMIAIGDFRFVMPETVEVIDDGSDGVRALLRVSGVLGKTQIMDQLDALSGSAPLDVDLEYELEPDSTILTLRTIITNPGETDEYGAVGDFISFGDSLDLFTRETGFDPPEDVGQVELVASRGDGVSYGYGRLEGQIGVPLSDAAGLGAILDIARDFPAGEPVTVERWFAVGDGSPSSVIHPILERMNVTVGVVTGVVRDAGGTPVAGLIVDALPVPESGAEPTHADNEARTDADGRFELWLSPGEHQLIAHGQGRQRSGPVTVTASATTASDVEMTIGERARVTVSITGEGPQPEAGTFPVAVNLVAISGQEPDPRLGESSFHGQSHTAWLGAGLDTFDVAPGVYDVTISHGPEFDRLIMEGVTLSDGSVLEGALARVIQPTGFVGCDFHQHTIGSLDGSSTLPQKLRANLTAGLGCAAITDHDNVTDLRPTVTELGANPAFHALVGDEISVNGVGHFNAFPIPLDPADPHALVGAQLWAGRSVSELFQILSELSTDPVLQINHPRSGPIKGYFSTLRYDAWASEGQLGTLAAGFQAVEVNASIGSADQYTPNGWALWAGQPSDDVPVLADWFGMLNRGWPICAIGNSDSHDPGDDAGYPRTYLDVGDSDPATLTDDAVKAAIRAQKAVVSRGAWLEVTVDGVGAMGHTEPVTPGEGGAVALHIRAHVPPWLSLHGVEVYANGLLVAEHLAEAPTDVGTAWFDDIVMRTPEVDTWFVVLTRGPTEGSPVFGGFTYAFTNPIYVDVDGDGFQAPGPVTLP
jgi:hypothetical protein